MFATLTLFLVLSPNASLIQAGRDINVLSLQGKQHPTLQKMAEEHAAYQARVHRQGHQGWGGRYSRLQVALPDCNSFKEVANQSWPGQDQTDAAKEAYHSWRQSSGHWSAVNGHCRYWGYAMVLGSNGTWYMCAIFAN